MELTEQSRENFQEVREDFLSWPIQQEFQLMCRTFEEYQISGDGLVDITSSFISLFIKAIDGLSFEENEPDKEIWDLWEQILDDDFEDLDDPRSRKLARVFAWNGRKPSDYGLTYLNFSDDLWMEGEFLPWICQEKNEKAMDFLKDFYCFFQVKSRKELREYLENRLQEKFQDQDGDPAYYITRLLKKKGFLDETENSPRKAENALIRAILLNNRIHLKIQKEKEVPDTNDRLYKLKTKLKKQVKASDNGEKLSLPFGGKEWSREQVLKIPESAIAALFENPEYVAENSILGNIRKIMEGKKEPGNYGGELYLREFLFYMAFAMELSSEEMEKELLYKAFDLSGIDYKNPGELIYAFYLDDVYKDRHRRAQAMQKRCQKLKKKASPKESLKGTVYYKDTYQEFLKENMEKEALEEHFFEYIERNYEELEEVPALTAYLEYNEAINEIKYYYAGFMQYEDSEICSEDKKDRLKNKIKIYLEKKKKLEKLPQNDLKNRKKLILDMGELFKGEVGNRYIADWISTHLFGCIEWENDRELPFMEALEKDLIGNLDVQNTGEDAVTRSRFLYAWFYRFLLEKNVFYWGKDQELDADPRKYYIQYFEEGSMRDRLFREFINATNEELTKCRMKPLSESSRFDVSLIFLLVMLMGKVAMVNS